MYKCSGVQQPVSNLWSVRLNPCMHPLSFAVDIRLLRSRNFLAASSVLYTFDSSGVIKLSLCLAAVVYNNRMFNESMLESNVFMRKYLQPSADSGGVAHYGV
jgi:hypothetical protein